MSYANKYKITFATKTSKTGYLYLQEDGYSGTVIEYPLINISLQYLPQSDDPYEPIFASQLNVAIDITDDMENMPNFTVANDRKYFVKLYLGSDLEWTGFTISDDVELSYTTGRKELSFNCVDGIGMLQSIPLYVVNTQNVNAYQTVLYFIRTCLNSLDLPTDPNIVTACSYYAQGMANRSTSSSNEPFSQTYLAYRTFLESATTYKNCFDILSNLLKSFGCRLFMSGGKWWIVAINEFANENVNYTEYTSAGAIASSGQFNNLSQIQGFTGNTSNVYFINNSQVKLLKKGFNSVQCTTTIQEPPSYFSNGNLKPYAANVPVNWTAVKNGTGSSYTIIENNRNNTAEYRLIAENTSGAYVKITATGLPFVNGGEILNFSWIYFNQSFSPNGGHAYVKITNGSTTYYWGGSPEPAWSTSPYAAFVDVGGLTVDNTANTFNFSTTACPINGLVSFTLALEDGTSRLVQVGAFELKITPYLKEVSYNTFTDSTDQYVKQVEIPYGYYNSGSYPVELGTFVNSSGATLYSWYQYGSLVLFPSLTGLLMQMYINVFGKNIINIDCSLASFETTNGYINAAKMFKATDTDPSQINIEANSYQLGNATIDYVNDETQSTLLQISNTTTTATNDFTASYNLNF
jgi:hypothetical protein